MVHRLLPLLTLWLAAAPLAGAMPQSRSFEVPFEVFRLENGLTVILSEDRTAPTYSIAVVYDVGSRDELPGRTGFAHLFEHMMFQGSENVGKGEHFILVQKNGGGMNGTTSFDRTNYYETLPSNQLDLGLFLEADRMRALDISQANLDNQREAVKEERRLRIDNQPYGNSFWTLNELAYDGFGYRHPIIGSMEDLDAATLTDVERFFAMYYAPNNAVVALVGDFDTREALAKVRQYFGDIPEQFEPPEVIANEPRQREERRAVIEDAFAQLPRVDIGYKGPPGNTPDWYMLSVLGAVMADGRSSRLYQRLVQEERVAINVSGGIDERRGNSLFQISATPAPGVEPAALEAMIYAEIARLQEDFATEAEIETVMMQAERRQAERLVSTLSRALDLAHSHVYYNDPGLINTSIEKRRQVTREQVRAAALAYLVDTNRTVVTTLPAPAGSGPGSGLEGGAR